MILLTKQLHFFIELNNSREVNAMNCASWFNEHQIANG